VLAIAPLLPDVGQSASLALLPSVKEKSAETSIKATMPSTLLEEGVDLEAATVAVEATIRVTAATAQAARAATAPVGALGADQRAVPTAEIAIHPRPIQLTYPQQALYQISRCGLG